jgi:hypothetical protein
VFVLSCGLLVFMYGIAVGKYEVFPYPILEFGADSFSAVIAEGGTLTGTRPTEYLNPARHPGNGVTVNEADKVAPGLTFISSFFDGGTELRLIRIDGSVAHRWPVRYSTLFPDTAHIAPKTSVPQSDWNAEIHGAVPLPDGSVVFNFNYLGTAKIGRCGETQWTLPLMTHHAVTYASDGTFLIPNWRYIEDNPRHANLHPPYMDETILRVSDRGQVLSEISVLDILYENNYQGLLARAGSTGDIIHVNDVEELTPDLAGAFPMFSAGDWMVSMRKGSSVLVVDPRTSRLKWYQSGPWKGQHDPDFLPTGKLLIFNNNEDSSESGEVFGGGSIMEVMPSSPTVTYRYGFREGERMYTASSGKHQPLSNGNILVTEAKAGRVFEADNTGRVVWEFINRYDETEVVTVTEASRFPENYFTVKDWSCSPATGR